MQILYRGQTERLWTVFKDSSYNIVDPTSGSVLIDIQYQDGTYLVQGASATWSDVGVYYYEYTPSTDAKYGYYGAWWRAEIEGIPSYQELPNPFIVEDRNDATYKAHFLESARSMLYMHMDSPGFRNKFPRDRELLDLLQNSLDWINAYPPYLTAFTFSQLPRQFYIVLSLGAVVLAMQAMGILEAGKHFIYNDNGISLTRDRSSKYLSLYSAVIAQYNENLKKIKIKYGMDHISLAGQFSSTVGYPRSLSRALRGVSKFS